MLSILCVDDNATVVDALRVKFSRTSGFTWKGSLSSADDLLETCKREAPSLVLLDVDMPGKPPFTALAELAERCPDIRVVMFSGHVRRDLIECALDAGAWGYVSKNDGEDELLDALRSVAAGELGFSPEASRLYHG